mmetsp:Transcript_89534/g.148818  ORF Transcript_89534/g.148818 Transcript_89534/m.148818 type:complete len:374 (+) Transcript_89534:1422-2543(+)
MRRQLLLSTLHLVFQRLVRHSPAVVHLLFGVGNFLLHPLHRLLYGVPLFRMLGNLAIQALQLLSILSTCSFLGLSGEHSHTLLNVSQRHPFALQLGVQLLNLSRHLLHFSLCSAVLLLQAFLFPNALVELLFVGGHLLLGLLQFLRTDLLLQPPRHQPLLRPAPTRHRPRRLNQLSIQSHDSPSPTGRERNPCGLVNVLCSERVVQSPIERHPILVILDVDQIVQPGNPFRAGDTAVGARIQVLLLFEDDYSAAPHIVPAEQVQALLPGLHVLHHHKVELRAGSADGNVILGVNAAQVPQTPMDAGQGAIPLHPHQILDHTGLIAVRHGAGFELLELAEGLTVPCLCRLSVLGCRLALLQARLLLLLQLLQAL